MCLVKWILLATIVHEKNWKKFGEVLNPFGIPNQRKFLYLMNKSVAFWNFTSDSSVKSQWFMHCGPTSPYCEILFLFHKTYIMLQDSFGNQEIDIKSQPCKTSKKDSFLPCTWWHPSLQGTWNEIFDKSFTNPQNN